MFQNIQTTEKFYVDKLSVTFSKASVENGPFSDIDRVIYFIVTQVHLAHLFLLYSCRVTVVVETVTFENKPIRIQNCFQTHDIVVSISTS